MFTIGSSPFDLADTDDECVDPEEFVDVDEQDEDDDGDTDTRLVFPPVVFDGVFMLLLPDLFS